MTCANLRCYGFLSTLKKSLLKQLIAVTYYQDKRYVEIKNNNFKRMWKNVSLLQHDSIVAQWNVENINLKKTVHKIYD